MTIYIHFRGARPTVKLYNVDQIIETAPAAFTIRNPFSDTPSTFDGVKRIAVEPDTDEE